MLYLRQLKTWRFLWQINSSFIFYQMYTLTKLYIWCGIATFWVNVCMKIDSIIPNVYSVLYYTGKIGKYYTTVYYLYSYNSCVLNNQHNHDPMRWRWHACRVNVRYSLILIQIHQFWKSAVIITAQSLKTLEAGWTLIHPLNAIRSARFKIKKINWKILWISIL